MTNHEDVIENHTIREDHGETLTPLTIDSWNQMWLSEIETKGTKIVLVTQSLC